MASSSFANDLSGAVYCVLSGASQGIGRALAVELAKIIGPKSLMVLLARNKEELQNTANLCSSDDVTVVCNSIDLSAATNDEMYKALSDPLKERKITDFSMYIIFHNVGSIGDISIESSRLENLDSFRQYYDLNVFNVITLNTQFMKIFQDLEHRIIIVNITSLCAIKPMTGMAFYCSGKAAREMYFKVLAEEKKHIQVLNYSPGPVKTAMIDYVLENACDKNLIDVFTSFQEQRTLLEPEVTAKKCMKVLQQGRFAPGEHVDYFDE